MIIIIPSWGNKSNRSESEHPGVQGKRIPWELPENLILRLLGTMTVAIGRSWSIRYRLTVSVFST